MLLSPSKRLEESKGALQKCRRYVTSQVFYLELCKARKVSIGEGANHFLKDQKRTLRTIFKAVFLLTHLSCSCCQLENVPEASCLSAHCLRKWLDGNVQMCAGIVPSDNGCPCAAAALWVHQKVQQHHWWCSQSRLKHKSVCGLQGLEGIMSVRRGGSWNNGWQGMGRNWFEKGRRIWFMTVGMTVGLKKLFRKCGDLFSCSVQGPRLDNFTANVNMNACWKERKHTFLFPLGSWLVLNPKERV